MMRKVPVRGDTNAQTKIKRPASGTNNYNIVGKKVKNGRPASMKSMTGSRPSSYGARAPSLHSTLGHRIDMLQVHGGDTTTS